MLRHASLARWRQPAFLLPRNVFLRRFVARKATPRPRIERINSRRKPITSHPDLRPHIYKLIEAFHSFLKTNKQLVPKFLHRYTIPLSNAPISHVTAFLLLHEITAIVPLLALFATFHYTSLQLPSSLTNSAFVTEGIEKFGRYFKRKGWLGETVEPEAGGGMDGNKWNIGQDGMKVLVEVGTAWAVVKMLLPVRLIGCVWLTPWFARIAVLPVSRLMGIITGRTGVKSPAGLQKVKDGVEKPVKPS